MTLHALKLEFQASLFHVFFRRTKIVQKLNKNQTKNCFVFLPNYIIVIQRCLFHFSTFFDKNKLKMHQLVRSDKRQFELKTSSLKKSLIFLFFFKYLIF